MAAGNGRNSGTASAKGLSSFVLKVVAIVGMTCNHAAYVFAGHLPFVGECVLFAVGGVTFPVMAYLLVEGYRHTSNVKRYALRLAAFAAVSQIPYALYLASNANVLFTLLIGLGLLYLDDHASSRAWYGAGVVAGTLVSLVCDWGFLGIVMIVLFKYLQGARRSSGACVFGNRCPAGSGGRRLARRPGFGRGGAIRPLRAARLAVSPGWLFGIHSPAGRLQRTAGQADEVVLLRVLPASHSRAGRCRPSCCFLSEPRLRAARPQSEDASAPVRTGALRHVLPCPQDVAARPAARALRRPLTLLLEVFGRQFLQERAKFLELLFFVRSLLEQVWE